jgi:hypothetical protein
MDLFSSLERTSDLGLGYKAMFVGIASNVGQRMIETDFDQDVSVRGDRSSALPTWTVLA